ncbi:hypothetical protein MCERE19_01533 [Spirosomataceae bacterium]
MDILMKILTKLLSFHKALINRALIVKSSKVY